MWFNLLSICYNDSHSQTSLAVCSEHKLYAQCHQCSMAWPALLATILDYPLTMAEAKEGDEEKQQGEELYLDS